MTTGNMLHVCFSRGLKQMKDYLANWKAYGSNLNQETADFSSCFLLAQGSILGTIL